MSGAVYSAPRFLIHVFVRARQVHRDLNPAKKILFFFEFSPAAKYNVIPPSHRKLKILILFLLKKIAESRKLYLILSCCIANNLHYE